MDRNIDSYIREQFEIGDVDIRTYSPLTLAFIGDGIFDLVIRSIVVGHGNTRPNELHGHTAHIVKAQTQSQMVDAIMPLLTEEELAVYKRGRNAKSVTVAKNASVSDYRRATGFEALMGYLYLQDQFDRVVELTKHAMKELDLK